MTQSIAQNAALDPIFDKHDLILGGTARRAERISQRRSEAAYERALRQASRQAEGGRQALHYRGRPSPLDAARSQRRLPALDCSIRY